jgi:ankyrin repeat protein
MKAKEELEPSSEVITSSSPLTFFSKNTWHQKLIEDGCSKKILNLLAESEKKLELEVDYKLLYSHFIKIRNERRENGQLILRVHANTVWKLLCLTGQLPCIAGAIQLIKEDTQVDADGITPEQQRDYNYIEAMNYAAYTGNIQGLQLLYNELQDKSLFDHPKLSALIFVNAIYSNDVKTLAWVINTLKIESSSLSKMKKNILHFATELGNVEMMGYAVTECKIDKNSSVEGLNALQIAVLYGKLDAVKYAIDKLSLDIKEKSNGKMLIHFAFEGGNLETIKYLVSLKVNIRRISEETEDNILHFAAMNGHADAMRYAVELGINVNSQNKNGATALHYAANSGCLAAVKCAVALGCLFTIDLKNGMKVLNFAADSGNLELFNFVVSQMDANEVKQLLNSDARIIKDIIQSNMGVDGIKFAVDCGFNLFMSVDNFSSNLLLIAARQNNPNNIQVFNYLLDAGVKPETNKANVTILHMAALSGDPELVRLTHQTLLKQDPDNDPLTNKGNCGAIIIHYAMRSPNPNGVVAVIKELEALALGQEPSNEPVKIAFI